MKYRLFDGSKWLEFDSIEEQQAYIDSLPKPEPNIDWVEVVKLRKEKGAEIMNAYLADNAAINLTAEQSIQQLQKFQVVKAFLEVGNLEDSKNMIAGIPVDDVFTQERKDKYLSMFL